MKIAVRMDDIAPGMNWENFYFFKGLFEECGITPLLGIVPDNRDQKLEAGPQKEGFWEEMRALHKDGWSIALHGCFHVYTTKKSGIFPLNRFSEFAGLPIEEQDTLIRKGARVLEEQGLKTDIFMPPGHTFDKNTLRALRRNGFGKITDGFGCAPYRWQDMLFYPISFHLGRSLKAAEGATTMVLHANTVTEKEKQRYREIFREYGGSFIPYQDFLDMPAEEKGPFSKGAEYGLAKLKYMLGKWRG